MNGGTGTITAGTCNPTTTTGSCNVTVSTTTPTRNGYKFLGWADSDSAVSASSTYTPGKTTTLTNNKTIYAVWQKLININTSVDGGNGTITPSMTGIAKGTSKTITFSPRAGYEIDNVKVNGTVTTVTNDKLTVVAGDEDINIVVKYKLIPDIDPPTTAYYMYFDVADGETGTPSTLSCTTTDTSCSVTIPATAPIRTGYAFLGYATFSDMNTVAYHPGETYTLSNDVYLLSVWAPIYTLSYNIQGGTGTVETQTCNPTTPNGTCSITISTTRPTKEGYEFFGWSTDAASSTPEYLPGDTFTFSAGFKNNTLYAIWIVGGVEWIQGQDYIKASGIDMIVEFDYPYQNFTSLIIDDTTVDSSHYTINPGSTIVTISSEYTDTLAEGGHIMQANYNNGVEARTTFAVIEEGGGDGGDDGDDEDDEDYNDVEDDEDIDINAPDTGKNTGGETGSSGIVILCMLAGLVVVLTTGGRKLLKKVQRRNKFGL